jgi:hypothetical protein
MGCARLATPGPRERLAGALAAWADQGKSRAGPGRKRRGHRGQLGRGSRAAEREEELREFSFYLFLFISLSFVLFENTF